MSNLCRGKPAVDVEKIKTAIPVLNYLLIEYESDSEVVTDTLWALSYISDGSNERIQLVLDNIELKRITMFLKESKIAILSPALRTIGNIVSGTDEQTQAVLNLNILGDLVKCLQNPKNSIVKETVWTLSNIAAGTQNQIQVKI